MNPIAAITGAEVSVAHAPRFAYVGSRTTRERHARGEGISVFKVDEVTGDLSLVQLLGGLVNPSYLCLSADGRCLYTVHGDAAEVSAFRVDRASGQLEHLNTQSTQGRNPVHLALAPTGRHLVVSNHIGASLAVLPVEVDGALGALTQLLPLNGPLGPHRLEQTQPKPHFNPFDPSGRFVLVPDKGLDRVFSFRFVAGALVPAEPPFTVLREGAGPRHLAFHPSGRWAYVVNELDSTVTACAYAAETGALTPFQVLSTLPATCTGNSRAAAIEVDAAGQTLYASNRGHDSIALFRIDAGTGLLSFLSAVPTQGRTPRFFTLAPGGRQLYALNEDSDSIVAFALDDGGRTLRRLGAPVRCGSPVCMVFSA
jgi:6-phosphogluconolactonase